MRTKKGNKLAAIKAARLLATKAKIQRLTDKIFTERKELLQKLAH